MHGRGSPERIHGTFGQVVIRRFAAPDRPVLCLQIFADGPHVQVITGLEPGDFSFSSQSSQFNHNLLYLHRT